MFEVGSLPAVSAVLAVDDTGLIDAIGAAARLEAATMARRLAAIAQLYHRRARQYTDRDRLVIDVQSCVAAEIAAAQHISRARAGYLLDEAVFLADHLPTVAAVFADGRVDYRVIAAVVSRTTLVTGDDDIARVDALLAPRLPFWNRLSKKKLAEKIDWCVTEIDLLAKKDTHTRDEDRYITIGPDPAGTAQICGTLRAPDAIALDTRLSQLADTVCPHDPRTKDQRRADATGALAAGAHRLTCLCGRNDCPVGSGAPPTPSNVLVQVVAEQATLTGDSDTPGYVPGYGPIPAEAVRNIAAGANKRTIHHPGDAPAEPYYRPSTALAQFIRLRDLTCRFPYCDVPARFCDLDHTVPWPHGPTHASNLKCLCRGDHLIKTFYTGPDGWRDRQHPDGTVEWTSPTGHIWTTTPGGALFFPQLAAPTGTLVLPSEVPRPPNGTLKMPVRDRTRAEDKRQHIDYQRARNHKRLYTEVGPPPF